MNQYLQQFLYSGVRMLTVVNCVVIVDGSGNPVPLDPTWSGVLVKSVEHIATGKYRIHLKDNFNAAVAGCITGVSSPTDTTCGVTYEGSEYSDVTSKTDPHVNVNCFNSSGVLTDPNSGTGFTLLLFGRNSSIAY